jgi:hypothetical protein
MIIFAAKGISPMSPELIRCAKSLLEAAAPVVRGNNAISNQERKHNPTVIA